MRRVPPWARPLVVLVAALAAAEIAGLVSGRHRTVPNEVLVAGLVEGCPAVLFAIGLVLVYRASRVINFAHGAIGFAAGVVFLTLQNEHWNYALCAAVAIGAAVLTGVVIDGLLLRRFLTAPRLVATVVTIAAGQLVGALVLQLPRWRFGIAPGDQQSSSAGLGVGPRLPGGAAHSPLTRLHATWGVEVFTGDALAAVVVTAVAAVVLTLFLRRSGAGVAIRGAAENSEKAATLGINTGVLTGLVWGIAAALSAISVLLSQQLSATTFLTVGASNGMGVLLAGLAAGVIGRMDDLATTTAAALGLSAFTGAVYFSTTNGSVVELVLLAVLAVALLSQRQAFGRVEAATSGGWAAAEEIRRVPSILREHISVRTGRRWIVTIGLIVLVGYPFAMSPSQVFVGGTFALFGIVAVSLVVLTGWGGQISLGQFAFVAVGAAVGGSLAAHGWPFALAWMVATVAGGAVAVLLGIPALRVRGLFLAVMTLAFALVVPDFFLDPTRFSWLTPGRVPSPSVFGIHFSDGRAFYYLALGALGASILVAQGLRRTRTGRVLIAMRDNERGAQALGLSLVRVRLTTFAISGALASFAGMLYASHVGAVRADGFGADQSIQVFLMAIIGGLGSVAGVLTGAVYLAAVQLWIHSTSLQLLAGGGGVMAILLFFPSGLGGAVFAARDAFLRRVALRERIHVPSLLGDLNVLTGDANRASLGPKVEANHATRSYELESEIADAGVSQRGRGWVYG